MAFSHTLRVATACWPNRSVCESPCPKPGLAFEALPNRFFLLPPCGPLLLALASVALVGGLGGAPFCFAVLFPLFPPLRLVRCSRYRVVGEGLLWVTILAQADDSVFAQVEIGSSSVVLEKAAAADQSTFSPSGAKPPTPTNYLE